MSTTNVPSTMSLTEGADPSSVILTTPSVQRVDAVKKSAVVSSAVKVHSTVSLIERAESSSVTLATPSVRHVNTVARGTVMSSSTKVPSTVSNEALSSAKCSPGRRPVSYSSYNDRTKDVHHRSDNRSREESPRPLDTNFRIPHLSRENEHGEKRRYKESSAHHPSKYRRTHFSYPSRHPLGERNSGFVHDNRASSSAGHEMRRDFHRKFR